MAIIARYLLRRSSYSPCSCAGWASLWRMEHDVQRRRRRATPGRKQNNPSTGTHHTPLVLRLFSFHPSHPKPPPPQRRVATAREESALTYARTRLHGVAGEEADLLRRQDFALQPQRDNGVRCVWLTLRAHNSGTISRQKQIDAQFTSPGYPLPESWLAGRRKDFCPPSFYPSFLDGDW